MPFRERKENGEALSQFTSIRKFIRINVYFTSNVAHMTLFQTEAEEGSIPNLRLAQRPSGVNDYRESRQI